MNIVERYNELSPLGRAAVIAASGTLALAGAFGIQLAQGENPCQSSESEVSWITAPVCQLPAAVLGLDASATPQTALQK